MERNANDSMSGAGQAGASNTGSSAVGGSTTDSFGATGGSTGGATTGGGTFGGSSVGSAAGSQGYAGGTTGTADAGSKLDAAKDKLTQGKDALGDRLGTVKEKASQLSATLADRLEAGAEKLRQRGQQAGGQQFAGTDGQTVAANDQMAAVTNRLAGGLQGTADFLREGDLQASIEQQVKEHPARTLLVAVGLGYLLGKALKK
ncbi:MAG TPA: hypothetical protein VFJ74_11325 [Gemmatimonadaceae bacterium]|nr:hypothetical protein [Gemmatimonadaceae bacterium]